jgi:hypothetical protein
MKNHTILFVLIVGLGGTISYFISGSLIVSTLTLLLGTVFLYFSRMNNAHRRENLNIIKNEEKLYFYLSDDILFTIDLPQHKNLAEVVKTSVQNEMITLKDIVREICFINFKNERLEKELNTLIQINRASSPY